MENFFTEDSKNDSFYNFFMPDDDYLSKQSFPNWNEWRDFETNDIEPSFKVFNCQLTPTKGSPETTLFDNLSLECFDPTTTYNEWSNNKDKNDFQKFDLSSNTNPSKTCHNQLVAPSFSKYKTQLHSEFDQFKVPQVFDANKEYVKICIKRANKKPKEEKRSKFSPPNPVAFKVSQNGDCQITKSVFQTTVNQVRSFLKSFHLNGIDWYDAFLEVIKPDAIIKNHIFKVKFNDLKQKHQNIINKCLILEGCDMMFPGTFSPSIVALHGLLEKEIIDQLNLENFQDSNIFESDVIFTARNEKIKTKLNTRNKISRFDFDISCNMQFNYVRFISNNNFGDDDFIYELLPYMFIHQRNFHKIKAVHKGKNNLNKRIRKGNAKKRSKSTSTLEHEMSMKLKTQLKKRDFSIDFKNNDVIHNISLNTSLPEHLTNFNKFEFDTKLSEYMFRAADKNDNEICLKNEDSL
ncbi:hypothetical protein QEN19_004197 [Hanseniaspora menglaensis]